MLPSVDTNKQSLEQLPQSLISWLNTDSQSFPTQSQGDVSTDPQSFADQSRSEQFSDSENEQEYEYREDITEASPGKWAQAVEKPNLAHQAWLNTLYQKLATHTV